MKNYELTYLISSELSEEEIKSLPEGVSSLIQNEGGIVSDSTLPSRKKLAYPIQKQTQAFLAVLIFSMKEENVIEFEKKLKLENKIIRYLLTIKPKKTVSRKETRVSDFKAREKQTINTEEKKVELKEIEKKLEEILQKDES